MKNLFLLFAVIALISCKKADEPPLTDDKILAESLNLPVQPYNYASPPLPAHLLQSQSLNIINTPANNPITDWGATLGRVLFYDKKLSKNGTVACESCHKQDHGFGDSEQFSEGFEGGRTKRHSMGIINSKYYYEGKFFWDERAASLEDQVLMPFQDSIEMGMTLPEVLDRINNQPFYPILFSRAYGTTEINTDKVAKALAQYVRSIVSYRSKYDEGRALAPTKNAWFSNFSALEMRGKDLFMEEGNGLNCEACHGGESFSSPGIRNNGLDAATTDPGVGGITGLAYDDAMFKAPSLRGITQRSRFMHDGRFASIQEVIEHYNSGVKAHPNLDFILKDPVSGLPIQRDLSEYDKQALVAFLETLADHALTTDPKYSDPFKP
jgi:cytochrome c peroxidase